MNHEDNTAQPPTEIPPELEVRIIAWILGESSAFEISELERLVAEKPEVASFKREMESVHGLVGEAVGPDEKPLRLSPERRAKLWQTIGAQEEHGEEPAKAGVQAKAPVVLPQAAGRRKRPNWWRHTTMIAAGVALGFSIEAGYRYSRESFESDDSVPNQAKPVVPKKEGVGEEVVMMEKFTAGEQSPWSKFKGKIRDQFAQSEEERKAAPENKPTALTLSSPPAAPAPKSADQPVVKLERYQGNERRVSGYKSMSLLAGATSREPLDSKDAKAPSVDHFSDSLRASGGSVADRTTWGHFSAETDRDSRLKQDRSNLADAEHGLEAKKATTFYYSGAGGVVAAGKNSGPAVGGTDEALTLAPFQVASGRSEGFAKKNVETSAFASPISDPANGVVLEKFVAMEKSPAQPAPSDSPPPPAVVGQMFDSAKVDKPLVRPAGEVPVIPDTSETAATKEPVSTFSLHVSDVSFRLAQTALARGEKPDPASIRPEEFYNAFDYGEPAPAMTDKISCRIEQSAHPALQQRNLVRIAMKVPATGRGSSQALHLTVLLDTSGSMEREDRAAAVHRALEVLISLLGANDRITLIGFARQPRLLAEQLPGDKAGQLLEILARTPAEGGTNLEEALKLGTELAHRQFDTSAQNRIVLLTDGAANLGDADPARLAASIEALRQQGIAFDACGVGLDGIDDTMLESLTRKGDGRYYVLNTPEAADAGFARQLAGAFRPAAENVKVQVRFNPSRVGSYRLIGFDQHRLKEEDFRNDKVDAAELAAEEAAVALYQVEVLPQGEGELGEVYVRFRDAATKEMVERSWTLSYESRVPAFDRATSTIQLAGVSALLAEKLRGGPAGEAIKLDELAPVITALRGHFANQPRVQELVAMYEQMRRLNRE